MNQTEAEEYLEAELSWDDEPSLSAGEKQRLLDSANVNDDYTTSLLNKAIHQGFVWKLAKAVEYHEGDESKVYDHLKERVAYWKSRIATSSGGVFAGGISNSDIDSRNADTDRPASIFSTGLHGY